MKKNKTLIKELRQELHYQQMMLRVDLRAVKAGVLKCKEIGAKMRALQNGSQLTKACSLTTGTRPFTRTHRYWNCPNKIADVNNLSTSWENVDCPNCLVVGGQVSPFDTSGS